MDHDLISTVANAVIGRVFSARRQFRRARRAEAAGQVDEARKAIRSAMRILDAWETSSRLFRRRWKDVVTFRLAAFDVEGAMAAVVRARYLGLPDSKAVAEEVADLAAEMSEWRDVADEARAWIACAARARSDRSGELILFVPSHALGLEERDQPLLRKSLRFVWGTIAETLREAGVPFEVRAQIGTSIDLATVGSRPYISHHTKSDCPGGLHIKATDQPGRFSFDRCGFSGWSEFAGRTLDDLALDEVPQDVANRFFVSERERIVSGNISKYSQPEANGAGLGEGYVFIALQTINDVVQELAHMPMLAMAAEVVQACRARRIPVVVKRHPRCRSARVARFLKSGARKGDFTVSAASIHSLLPGCSAVCTVNSSVGAEALLHLKPVYLFGRSEYQRACFRILRRGDFADRYNPYRLPIPEDALKRFLYRLRHEYSVDVTNTAAARSFIRGRVLDHVAAAAGAGLVQAAGKSVRDF